MNKDSARKPAPAPAPAPAPPKPRSAILVGINTILADNPSLVNEDPTGKAWFFKMKVADLSVLDGLMDEAAYNEMIG